MLFMDRGLINQMVLKIKVPFYRKFLAHNNPWLKTNGITISLEQWEKPVWPDYIMGTCVFMTGESARKIAKTASITRKAKTIPIEGIDGEI